MRNYFMKLHPLRIFGCCLSITLMGFLSGVIIVLIGVLVITKIKSRLLHSSGEQI